VKKAIFKTKPIGSELQWTSYSDGQPNAAADTLESERLNLRCIGLGNNMLSLYVKFIYYYRRRAWANEEDLMLKKLNQRQYATVLIILI